MHITVFYEVFSSQFPFNAKILKNISVFNMNRYIRTFVRSTNIKSKLKKIKNTLILNKIRFRIIYFQILCILVFLLVARMLIYTPKSIKSHGL